MSTKIKRVYIAGILSHAHGYYSKNTAINYIIGARTLARWGLKALFAGFDPYVPSFDQWFWWVLGEDEYITEAMIKRFSKTWLEACDAVVLTPGWQQSPGTLAEIKHAESLGIPVFKSLDELIKHTKEQDEPSKAS